MNSTLNFIDGHQISYAVAGACALFLFLLLLFELLRTRLYWIYEPRVHRDDYKSKTPPAPGRTPFAWVGTCRRRRRASAAAKTTTTDPRAQTLALRPRLGLVLWGLAGLEERPERNVVLPPQLTALLAPGPRGLARVDDGRAGLHLLVLSVGETRRVAIHNLKHVLAGAAASLHRCDGRGLATRFERIVLARKQELDARRRTVVVM